MWIKLTFLFMCGLIRPVDKWLPSYQIDTKGKYQPYIKGGFDSLNVRFVGCWSFGPCYAVAMDTARNIVFIGAGGGVYLLNVSEPSNPSVISTITTRGKVSRIFYDYTAKRLYVAAGQAGLEIWSVDTPDNPHKLGIHWTPGYSEGVQIAGSYAYVADGCMGLRIIDVSDPTNPYEVGYYDTPGEA